MNYILNPTISRESFLATVLPAIPQPDLVLPGFGRIYRNDGYVFFANNGNIRRQSCVGTIDSLLARADEASSLGFNAYFALAGFKEGSGNRKAESVEYVRSLWMDLDAGEGKDYPHANDAFKDLMRFDKETGLHPTFVVSSGRGLHVYWCFTENMGPERWRSLATAFYECGKAHGLKIDPHRARDLASVLRVPGTLHVKSGKTVRIAVQGPVWDQADFINVLVKISKGRRSTAPVAQPAKPATPAQLAGMESSSASFELVWSRCEAFRMSFTAGYAPWFAGLSVCKGCANGEDWAHRCSSQDPRYDSVDTQAKYDSIAYPPAHCSRFADVFPDACARCPWHGKIVSPIWHGYHPDPAVPDQPPAKEEVKTYDHIYEKLNSGTGVEPLALSTPEYYVNDEGSWAVVSMRQGQNVPVKLFDEKIYYLYSNIRERSLGGKGGEEQFERIREFVYKVEFTDGKVTTLTLNADHLTKAQSLQACLRNNNLYPNSKVPGAQIMAFFNAYAEARKKSKTVKELPVYDSFGWTKYDLPSTGEQTDGFVVKDKIVTYDGLYPCSMSKKSSRGAAGFIGAKGSIEKWKESLNLYKDDLDLPCVQFMIGLAFVAPLMRFVFGEAKNGIFSLFSTQSGRGKTTALRFCASIWGDPYSKGTFFTRDESLAARNASLGTLKNIPAFMDELTDLEDRVMSSLAYALCNGKEKNKLKSGGDDFVATGDWNTITFVTANTAMKAAVARDSKGTDATLQRIIEYQCDFPDHSDHPDILQKINEALLVIQDNYGLAGPDFIYQLLRDRARLANFGNIVAEWVKKHGFRQEERFLSYPIAAALQALEWTNDYGYTNFDLKKVENWVMQCLVPQNREDTSMYKISRTVNIGDFINANLDSILVVKRAQRMGDEFDTGMDGGVDKFVIRRPRVQLKARYEQEDHTLYVSSACFKEWCDRVGLDQKFVLESFKDAGVKCKRDTFTLARWVSCYPSSRVRCIVFSGGELNDVELPPDPNQEQKEDPRFRLIPL